MSARVTIDTDGRRVFAQIPWNGGLGPTTAKSIPGARWSPKDTVWTYPLTLETCRDMRTTFGRSLRIGTALADWAREALVAEMSLAAVAGADARHALPLPTLASRAPGVYGALEARAYQTHAAAFLAKSRAALLADQPGLGKTLETFAGLIEGGVRGCVLVVAPATSLTPTWAAEVGKWLGELGASAHVAAGPPRKRREAIAAALADPAELRFLMVNPEMCRTSRTDFCPGGKKTSSTFALPSCDGDDWSCPHQARHRTVNTHVYPELFASPWGAIVADEIHKYLLNSNPRSRKTSLVGRGLQLLKTTDDGMRVAISGTPMKGKPRLLWPVFRWLRPDSYSSQWRWTQRYFVQQFDERTGRESATEELRPEQSEAFNAEVGRMMMRRTKKELRALNPAWAPPEKRYAEVWLEMSPKQSAAYAGMSKNATAMLTGGRLDANGILAEMTRMRQFSSCAGEMVAGEFRPAFPSNKYDWLAGTFLPRHGITGSPKTDDGSSKVVIASQFTQFINLWADELKRTGIDCHVLTGATKMDDRAAIVRDWQADGGPRVLLLNTNAGGVSITLDYADDLVIMDETWVPDDQEQVEDRVHRTSRTDHQVTIYYVRSEGTIERELAGSNVIKDDRQKRVLDGRRGIEWARSLVKDGDL